MFDEVNCDYPLPGKPPAFIKPGHRFQTKDLECEMRTYTIAADGAFSDSDFTGTIDFYTDNIVASGPGLYTKSGEDAETVEYRATIHAGKLVSLIETERETTPALPRKPFIIPKAAPEQVAEWRQRQAESLIGRKLYVLWGGQDEGYFVDVIAESPRQYCVRTPSGEFELLYRSDRDRIVWDTEVEAKAARQARNDEWAKGRAEYEAHVAARKS